VSIEAARAEALERARAKGQLDAAQRRYLPGSVFPIQREAYREAYHVALKPARIGRPRKDAQVDVRREADGAGRREAETIPSAVGSVGENRGAGMEPAASSVDLLPTDAALRRGVAGRATAGSSAAPAGVLS